MGFIPVFFVLKWNKLRINFRRSLAGGTQTTSKYCLLTTDEGSPPSKEAKTLRNEIMEISNRSNVKHPDCTSIKEKKLPIKSS